MECFMQIVPICIQILQIMNHFLHIQETTHASNFSSFTISDYNIRNKKRSKTLYMALKS
jgi:hypothetical protein